MAEPRDTSRRVDPLPPTLMTASEREWRAHGPTALAIRAFGARESSLSRLPGGQGQAWSDGRLVLKPVGFAAEHAWICDTYAGWRHHDVLRVPEPIRPQRLDETSESPWIADRWAAHVWVLGREAELLRELDAVKEASDVFHGLLADEPRPGFLDHRDDPWSYGDRLAWEDAPPDGDATILAVIARLRDALAPVSSPDQVIHGDILPNVLVAEGRPAAVIDWPPYYRPRAMARAIAITDAVTFRAGPLALFDEWAEGDDWNQLLVRALLYRLGPTGIFTARGSLMGSLTTHAERVAPVVDAVLAR
jgi:hypothetical protein